MLLPAAVAVAGKSADDTPQLPASDFFCRRGFPHRVATENMGCACVNVKYMYKILQGSSEIDLALGSHKNPFYWDFVIYNHGLRSQDRIFRLLN